MRVVLGPVHAPVSLRNKVLSFNWGVGNTKTNARQGRWHTVIKRQARPLISWKTWISSTHTHRHTLMLQQSHLPLCPEFLRFSGNREHVSFEMSRPCNHASFNVKSSSPLHNHTGVMGSLDSFFQAWGKLRDYKCLTSKFYLFFSYDTIFLTFQHTWSLLFCHRKAIFYDVIGITNSHLPI